MYLYLSKIKNLVFSICCTYIFCMPFRIKWKWPQRLFMNMTRNVWYLCSSKWTTFWVYLTTNLPFTTTHTTDVDDLLIDGLSCHVKPLERLLIVELRIFCWYFFFWENMCIFIMVKTNCHKWSNVAWLPKHILPGWLGLQIRENGWDFK